MADLEIGLRYFVVFIDISKVLKIHSFTSNNNKTKHYTK